MHVAGGAIYTEGAVWGLQVKLLGGAGIGRLVAFRGELLMQADLTLQLAPGRYELQSYQRPCDGNCDLLDAATDRCRARFSLKNGQRLHAIVRVRDGRPCAIRFVKP